MSINIEIKAKLTDPEKVSSIAAKLSSSNPDYLSQKDTFFSINKGRLKLRVFSDKKAELIYYQRSDVAEIKESKYRRISVVSPKLVYRLLSFFLGVRGEVEKNRVVYFVGQTRVHIDTVKGIGNFIELEVVLNKGQSFNEGSGIARNLMKTLHIKKADLVEGSYIDLISAN